MGLGIDGDRFRASEGRGGGDDAVLVRGILAHNCDDAFAPVRNVNQLFSRIPSQRIHARRQYSERTVALKSTIPNNSSVEYQRVSRERRENGIGGVRTLA